MKTSDIRIGNIVSIDNLIECKVIEIKEKHIRVEYIREDTQLPHRPLIEIERISPVHVYDMEKETLEEAAKRIYPDLGYKEELYCDLGEHNREMFLQGAKWQAERMYSEEELEVAFFEGRENNLPFTEWFESYKKK